MSDVAQNLIAGLVSGLAALYLVVSFVRYLRAQRTGGGCGGCAGGGCGTRPSASRTEGRRALASPALVQVDWRPEPGKSPTRDARGSHSGPTRGA